MTEPRGPWTAPRSSLTARILRPRWTEAERAFPALRNARGVGPMDRSGGPRPSFDLPEGDWGEEVRRMHADVALLVEVVLRDSTDPLRALRILEPFTRPKLANRIDRENTENGAVYSCDVEGEGTYRIRYCELQWRGLTSAAAREYAAAFDAWRSDGLAAASLRPVGYEDHWGKAINRNAAAWCVGPSDRIELKMERAQTPGMAMSATRAWVLNRRICK